MKKLLVCCLFFVLVFGLTACGDRGGGDNVDTVMSRDIPTQAPDEISFAMQASIEAYQSGNQAMTNRNWEQAINDFRNVIGDDENFISAQANLTESIVNFKNNLFAAIPAMEAVGSYEIIIAELETALIVIPGDVDIVSSIADFASRVHERERAYVSERIAEIIAGVRKSGDFDDGISRLQTLRFENPNFSDEIAEAIENITPVIVMLFDRPYVEVGDAAGFAVSGNEDNNRITIRVPGPHGPNTTPSTNHVVYELEPSAMYFQAILNPPLDLAAPELIYRIYGDGRLLYTSPIFIPTTAPLPINIDVRGASRLKIEVELRHHRVSGGWGATTGDSFRGIENAVIVLSN